MYITSSMFTHSGCVQFSPKSSYAFRVMDAIPGKGTCGVTVKCQEFLGETAYEASIDIYNMTPDIARRLAHALFDAAEQLGGGKSEAEYADESSYAFRVMDAIPGKGT